MKKNLLRTLVLSCVLCLASNVSHAQTITQLFTANGTFTVPPCVTTVQVESWGGGGGGGGSITNPANNSGGGGGGGAYVLVASIPVTPGNTYNVVVGAGGTAGSAVSGGNGGSSSFNGTAVAAGGAGGALYNNFFSAGNGAGGAGGTGGTYNGGNGHSGSHPDSGGGGGGGAGNGGNGGAGGLIVAGTGGNAGAGAQPGGVGGDGGTTDGLPGVAPGGGGGGGNTQNLLGGTSHTGGVGAHGQVIITWLDHTPIITSVTGGGCAGGTITVNGTNLNSASSVTIGATAVTNLIISPTVITGTIAAGTTTGLVTVTTPCGSATSSSSFIVNAASPPVNLGTQSICQGGSYSFGGQSYSAAGTYSYTTPSTITGCDSTTTVTIAITSVTTQAITQSVCSGGSFNFGGQIYNVAGVYADTTTSTITGCDSITTLTLSVTPVVPQTINQSVCTGGSYNFNGTLYSAAGTYSDTLSGAGMNGCDSIVTLILAISPYPSATVNDSICQGANYNFNGNVYTVSGTYSDTLIGAGANGCDSIVILNLGIKSGSGSPVTASSALSIMCASDSIEVCATAGFTSYLWNNAATDSCIYVTHAGNYYVTATDNNGCTATSNHLGISVYPLPAVSISVNGDTLIAYGAVSYQWYRDGSIVGGATSNIYIATVGGSYSVLVTDSNGCNAVSNPVVITGIFEFGMLSAEFGMNPNPANSFVNISMEEKMIGSNLTLYDVTGRKMLVVELETRNSKLEISHFASGVYFVAVENVRGRMTRKLIIQK